MKREFYDIYGESFNLFKNGEERISSSEEKSWRKEIANRINELSANLEIENDIRPDAKLFLLVNFFELILHPILKGRTARSLNLSPDDILNQDDELKKYLDHDLRIILKSSKQSQRELSRQRDEKRKISGHDVVNAISRSWSKLNLLKVDVWG